MVRESVFIKPGRKGEEIGGKKRERQGWGEEEDKKGWRRRGEGLGSKGKEGEEEERGRGGRARRGGRREMSGGKMLWSQFYFV